MKEGKRLKIGKKRRKTTIVLGYISVLVLLVCVISVMKDGTANSVVDGNINEESSVIYQTDEIEIHSLFQSSVMNPDCSMAFGDNVASIELKNISGAHIETCEIQITDQEGEEYIFLAQDIPVEMTVIAFDRTNKVLSSDVTIKDIVCDTKLVRDDLLMKNQVEYLVDETKVSITNKGKEDLSDLIVTCHCLLDGTYFGGTKYEYSVAVLPVGETVIVDATDCYIGQASVVRLTVQ